MEVWVHHQGRAEGHLVCKPNLQVSIEGGYEVQPFVGRLGEIELEWVDERGKGDWKPDHNTT